MQALDVIGGVIIAVTVFVVVGEILTRKTKKPIHHAKR